MIQTSRLIRIARRILDAVLLLLVGAVLATLAIARLVPAITGGMTLVVSGGSMEPAIPVGAAVIDMPVAPEQLAVGDVVSLRVGEQHAVFTHRITRIVTRDGALWLATRGDANGDADPSLVPATAVLGRVAVAVPWAGYAVAVMSSAQGVALLVSLGLFALAGAWLLETFEIDPRERLARGAAGRRGAAIPDPAAGQVAAG
jgi:signal peptidase